MKEDPVHHSDGVCRDVGGYHTACGMAVGTATNALSCYGAPVQSVDESGLMHVHVPLLPGAQVRNDLLPSYCTTTASRVTCGNCLRTRVVRCAFRVEVRKTWLPRHPVLKDSCVSCPFRKGNDAEFGGILEKLSLKNGYDGVSVGMPLDLPRARRIVCADVDLTGTFICHLTAYTPEMELRDPSEHRQCAGAAEWFRKGGALQS